MKRPIRPKQKMIRELNFSLLDLSLTDILEKLNEEDIDYEKVLFGWNDVKEDYYDSECFYSNPHFYYIEMEDIKEYDKRLKEYEKQLKIYNKEMKIKNKEKQQKQAKKRLEKILKEKERLEKLVGENE